MATAEENKIKKIRKLMKEILRYKELYYSGKAVISDGIYDVYERQLEYLDPQNPVVHMVGFDPTYVVPRGYVPDPTIVFNSEGIFRDGQPITRNQVGTFHK
jgi:hypothetical protein